MNRQEAHSATFRASSRLAIVPAYNESGSIARVVRELRAHAPEFDVLVIDDGSTDRTMDAAREAGAVVVRHPFNLGIGGAMQSGYVYAAENGYDVAVQVDGDGQHDPRHVGDLLDHLHEHPDLDMVTGSRFLAAEGDGYRSSASRRVGIRIFARVISGITGQQVTDPTSGFRMARRRGIELFASDYPHDYPEVEAILMMHAHQLKSAELPVTMRSRASGVSSINSTRSVYYMIKVLLAIFVGLFRSRPTVTAGDPAPVAAQHSL
jgi:glycosyltransferase involved in cell wall biosynthesis